MELYFSEHSCVRSQGKNGVEIVLCLKLLKHRTVSMTERFGMYNDGLFFKDIIESKEFTMIG
jgi:hypothetical protein